MQLVVYREEEVGLNVDMDEVVLEVETVFVSSATQHDMAATSTVFGCI